jgi:cellulose synthase operon protein C
MREKGAEAVMARKRLNKTLVVALSLCAFAAMIILSAVMLQQLAQRDPKYFVELAQKAEAQGEWQQAAVFYKQAWDRTNDPNYLVQFGDMMLHEGDVQNARAAWAQALIQNPALVEGHVRQVNLHLRQAELYGSSQDWDGVREVARAMLAAVPDGNAAAIGHHALGLSLVRSREPSADTDEGLNELRKAYELEPDEVAYAIDLAEELVRRDEDSDAQALYDKLITDNVEPGPAASKARTAYAKYLAFRDKGDQSQDYFKQAIDMAGSDIASRSEARLAYAGFLMQKWVKSRRAANDQAQAFYDSAEKLIEESIHDDPNAFDSYLQLASLYRLAAEHEKVVEVCEKRIKQGLDRKGVEGTKNRLNTFTLMTYASEAAVALSVQAGAAGDFAERDRWLARADQYVVDAKGEAPTHPMVLSQSGRVKIARGQERAGLEELRASDEAYQAYGKISWDNRLIRARVHLQLNESGAARAVLEEVISEATRTRASDPTFWNLYAQTLVQAGELERAMNVVDRTLALAPGNKDAKRIKAAIFERQGKHAEAGKWEEEISGSGTVRAILEARAAAIEGDTQKAMQLLTKAFEAEPSNPRVVASLSSELAQLGRFDEARDVVRKARAADPDNDTFKALELSLRAELTPQQREAELLRLIEAEQDGFKRALSLVAFYSRKNEPALALSAIEQAEKHADAADTPSAKVVTSLQRAALLRTKLRAASQLKNEEAMAKARDDAARLNVDGAGGKSILGLYHYARREFDLAARAFEAALEVQPTHVTSWVLLGQSLQALGRIDESRAAFTKAVEINPNDGPAHQGLALLAKLTGDTQTFERELAICEKLMPDDPWIREQVSLRTEAANPREALIRREKQLAEKEDPVNLERLAELYEAAGDRQKADRAYDRLLQLLPNDARIVNAAALHYRKTHRGERAVDILRQYMVSRATPQEQAIAATVLAGEQFQQKDFEGAERTLLEATKQAPSLEVAYALGNLYQHEPRRPEKSIVWFDKAVDIASQNNASILPALLERRIVALLDREVNDLVRAREEAAAFRRRYPDNPRGYLIQSEVQARAGEIDQAVASLTDYLSKRPNDAYALMQRAQHQIAQGRMQAAVADLERIKQSASAEAATPARILLAKIHEREGRVDRALAELESLANQMTDSFSVYQELVAAYIRQKRFAEAERIATGMINRMADEPDPRWLFLRGQVSMELKDAEKALADFRRGAEAAGHNPAAVNLVLGSYIGLNQFAKGVQYYEGLGSRDEKDSEILAKFARLLAGSGQSAKAIELFRRAMAIAMATSGQHVHALMNHVLGSFTAVDAIEQFEKTECPPELTRANERVLARLFAAAGRSDHAMSKLDSLIQSATNDRDKASLWYEKGEVSQVAGDHQKALAAYEESLRYDPNNWYTLNNIAYLFSEKHGQHETALSYAKKAVAKADNPYTLDTLGWILVHMEQHDAAVAELSRAIRLDSDYALSYYHLGEAYRRMGRFDEAVQVLETGLLLAKSQKQTELVGLMEAALAKARTRDAAA